MNNMALPLGNAGSPVHDKDNKRPQPDGQECEENAVKKQKTEVIDRVKRKKVAMLLGYSGKDYYGMQRNPGMKTIEEDLIQALQKAQLITDEAFETIQTIQFQRAARTDKGVSAAGQDTLFKKIRTRQERHSVLKDGMHSSRSFESVLKTTERHRLMRNVKDAIKACPKIDIKKLTRNVHSILIKIRGPLVILKISAAEHGNKDDINAFLQEKIRIFGIKRVTKGFNSKSQCDARTYTYTLPTFAFAPESLNSQSDMSAEEFDLDKKIEELSTIEGKPFHKYRIAPELIEKVNTVLSLFEGTHNFHNFTSKVKPLDPSANRYIMKFSCMEPFVSRDLEFITLKVKGQSFMLHQIRKMVALAIAIVRNLTKEETLTGAYGMEKMDIPIAPSLGLVLDQVHYDRYNQRYSKDGIHESLEWPELSEEIDKFKKDYILEHIIETEQEQNSMLKWLATLNLHTYGIREEHVNG